VQFREEVDHVTMFRVFVTPAIQSVRYTSFHQLLALTSSQSESSCSVPCLMRNQECRARAVL